MRLGILISGRGSNMQAIQNAILAGTLNAQIAVVISNQTNAQGLAIAQSYQIPVKALSPKAFPSQSEYEAEIVKTLQFYQVELVVLAGYMKIVGDVLLAAYPKKIINIHPSLLPSFKGLHAQRQALEAGVKIAGCTVHYVDQTLDGGPIFLQDSVPVLDDDTEDSLSERILEKEHQLLPKAIGLIGEKRG